MCKASDFHSYALMFLMVFLVSCVPKAGMLHFQEFNRSPLQEAARMEESNQMGDRDFVRSALAQVFDLNEQEVVEQLSPDITGAKGFGVTCDPYTSVRRATVDKNYVVGNFSYDYPEAVPEDICGKGIGTAPTTNTIRNGNSFSACSALILPSSTHTLWSRKVDTLRYFLRAMQKIDPNFILIENNAKVPDRFKPTAESIKKAYRLFHVIRDADPKVVDALLSLSEETKEMSTDGKQTYWYRSWQYILFSLCSDPEWQLISI